MNLLILTILIYGNGHFISIKFIQMERRNTCLLHNSIWNLLRSSFQHSSNSFLLKRARESFWEHYKANGRMNDRSFPSEFSPPSHIGLKSSTACLQVGLGIPHHTHLLILPCKSSIFYFQFFYWHIVGAKKKKKRFFPLCLPIWIHHLLPWLYMLLFNNF